MAWDQAGYNQFLENPAFDPVALVDPQEFEQTMPQFSGSKLTGLIQSQDGRVKVDLDNNAVIISDGVIDRLRLGKLSDGSYGFLVQDKNGNKLMQIGDTNFIQSANQHMILDFNAETLTVYDESNTPVALFGVIG